MLLPSIPQSRDGPATEKDQATGLEAPLEFRLFGHSSTRVDPSRHTVPILVDSQDKACAAGITKSQRAEIGRGRNWGVGRVVLHAWSQSSL